MTLAGFLPPRVPTRGKTFFKELASFRRKRQIERWRCNYFLDIFMLAHARQPEILIDDFGGFAQRS